MHTMESAQSDQLRAFNRLVPAHQDTVYNLAYRLLGAEDEAASATQEALVRVFRNGPVAGESDMETLLLCELVRVSRNFLDEPTARTRWTSGKRGGRKPVAGDPLQSRLLDLPFDQRLALVLVDLCGLDYRRAAVVLGLGMPALRSKLALARRSLLAAGSAVGAA